MATWNRKLSTELNQKIQWKNATSSNRIKAVTSSRTLPLHAQISSCDRVCCHPKQPTRWTMIKVLSTNYSGKANRRRLWFFNESKEKSNSSHHSETISPCEFQTRMFPNQQRKSKRHARERYLNPSGKRVEISTPALTVPAENRRKLDLLKVLTKECMLSSRN